MSPQSSSQREGEASSLDVLTAAAADRALVVRLRARDEAAFVELINRHHGSLLRLALVFVPNRAVAEEVVQETWTAVIDGLDRFEGRSSLKTWIFRILTNRARTRGVREGRSVPFSAVGRDAEAGEAAVDPERFNKHGHWSHPPRSWSDNTPEQVLLRQAAMRQLEQALTELPAQQRAVVALRDIDGLDAGEVCSILEVSETNQRVLLHRARAKLRRALEAYYDGAAGGC